MAEHPRGVIDTSVLIDLHELGADLLPAEIVLTAITLAELSAGPHAARDTAERARRQNRLQLAESGFVALPFDTRCARAYGVLHAAARAHGRTSKAHLADHLIAATALANELPLYTRNVEDFRAFGSLLTVVGV